MSFREYVENHRDNQYISSCIDLIGFENTVKCCSLDGVKSALSSKYVRMFYDRGL